jgi:hypothetical protein
VVAAAVPVGFLDASGRVRRSAWRGIGAQRLTPDIRRLPASG